MQGKSDFIPHLFTDNSDLPQEQIVANILAHYQASNVLARSILSGDNLGDAAKFEEDLWFDLDQTRRQAKLNGKPYRDPASYLALLKPLEKATNEIAEKIKKYENAGEEASSLVVQLKNKVITIEEVKNQISQLDLTNPESILANEILIFAIKEYEYVESGQAYKDWEKNRNYRPPHTHAFYSFTKNVIDSLKSGAMRLEILKKHGIVNELYTSTIKQIAALKHQGKDKKISFASKEDAERTLKEYMAYRIAKNSLHNTLKDLFPQHFRKQSIELQGIETDYAYFTGFQPFYREKSVNKIGLPSVPEDQEKFIPRNRIKENKNKVIATPASWSYLFPDIPIGLFDGRKGSIAFALIGIEKNMMTMFHSHRDSSSTSLINPFYLAVEMDSKMPSKEELLRKKRKQRKQALDNLTGFIEDHWFNKETKVSGHTESVIYGAPTEGGIIIQEGWEDVAWEARKRYAQRGFMPKNAPFFTYDPHLGLKHVKDDEVFRKAKCCHESQKNRLTYEPTLQTYEINLPTPAFDVPKKVDLQETTKDTPLSKTLKPTEDRCFLLNFLSQLSVGEIIAFSVLTVLLLASVAGIVLATAGAGLIGVAIASTVLTASITSASASGVGLVATSSYSIFSYNKRSEKEETVEDKPRIEK